MKSFRLTKENATMLAQQYATPLEVISTKHIEENYKLLCEHIPRLKVFYAIKANPANCILQKLISLGANFDVASAGEIRLLSSLGVTGDRMIYANPVKTIEGLMEAAKVGIKRFTFDSKNEINKIKKYVSDAEVLARVKIKKTDAIVNLNIKFGADEEEILNLLNYAKENGLKASGICFHVGSQVLSSNSYIQALALARGLINKARQNGIDIKYMDIGGGLPAPHLNRNIDIVDFIQDLNNHLKDFKDVEIWAEPGRYICASAVNILTSVIGKQIRDNKPWYYIDDGIYGSFSGILFDHWDYDIITMKDEQKKKNVATIAGPSCDSLDIVKKEMICPELNEGDLLIALNAGAYGKVSASTFNGFAIPKTVEFVDGNN